MRDANEIMGLVNEVRGILSEGEEPSGGEEEQLDEAGKLHHMTHKKLMKKHKGMTPHNPFKHLKKGKHLGGTSKQVAKIKGPSTTTPGSRKGFWKCRCSNYKCLCLGKTAEGAEVKKTVHIGKSYKKGYNQRYRKWRAAHQKLFAPGGKRGFTKPKKKGKAGWEE